MLFRAPLLVLDTESNGLPKFDWAQVIEIGGVLLNEEGEEVDNISLLVRPDVMDERTDQALQINGIDRGELLAAPRPDAAWESIRWWLDDIGWPYATAYNVGFDRPMLERTFPDISKLQWARDIMDAAMGIMGPAGVLRPKTWRKRNDPRPWLWPSLTAKKDKQTGEMRDGAAEFFGVELEGEQTHRALDDARIAAAVACAIRRKELERGAA